MNDIQDIKPTRDIIVMEAVEEEITKIGSLWTPPSEDRNQFGKVLAVGSSVKEVKAGDKVFFPKRNTTREVRYKQFNYLFIKEHNIIAVIEE